jgi:hypothetical protein
MTEDNTNDADTSFIRQRRDLFVISSILILGRLSHATLDEISILGLGLKIGHPEALVWGLWALWSYWLIRYCQAYIEFTNQPVILAYARALQDELRRRAMKFATRAVVPMLQKSKQTLNNIAIGADGIDAEGRWVDWHAYAVNGNSAFASDRYRPVRLGTLTAHLVAVFRITFLRMTFTDYWFPFLYAIAAPITYWVTRN